MESTCKDHAITYSYAIVMPTALPEVKILWHTLLESDSERVTSKISSCIICHYIYLLR